MSSGDKGVQGLQYLNYFSYSLKFLLLNVSLFYLKQDKRVFTTQIFPALVFSNEGGYRLYCIDNDILKEFLKTYRSEVTKSMQLNYEFDRQLELERADAIEEGMEIGENKMLFTLVTKGKLDIDTAAEEAGVSVSEFEKLMREAGYKVPETV